MPQLSLDQHAPGRPEARLAAAARVSNPRLRAKIGAPVARLLRALVRATGRGSGTSLPGIALLAIDPRFLSREAQKLPGGVVLVSGTNGKTTTASIIRHILQNEGFKVVGNQAGANLRQGAATALLDGRGADIAVLEIDEAALAEIATDMKPHVMVFTNVFRDQLDRYGEVETVAGLLSGGASKSRPDATVVYNGDDPLLHYSLRSTGRPAVAFGLRASKADPKTSGAGGEPEVCPRCGRKLSYRYRTFAHLGGWSCSCGLEGPSSPFRTEIVRDDGFEGIQLSFDHHEVRLASGGVHNAYNAVAAVASAIVLGVPPDSAIDALASFTPRFGRAETIRFHDHEINIALVKNPAGTDAVIHEIRHDAHIGAVVVSINDRDADGHDPSWIWDADFEELTRLPLPLIASGYRATDVAVRLKHAGRPPEAVEPDPRSALKRAVEAAGDRKVAVLANYTAMLDLRTSLSGKRGSLEDAG